MTAKFSASADGTKVYIGNASENALEIDATGKTIKPVAPYNMAGNGPAYAGSLSAAATISGSLLLSPTPVFNVGGVTVVNGNQFVPTVAGYYAVTLALRVSATSAQTYLAAQIKRNAAVVCEAYGAPYSSNYASAAVSGLVYMNGTTDYLEFFQDIGGTPTGLIIQTMSCSLALVRQG